MPHIQIADEPHPRDEAPQTPAERGRRSSRTLTWVSDIEARTLRLRRARTTDSVYNEDGIYNIRSRSAAPPLRAATFRSQDDDPGLRQASDYKQAQVFSGTTLLWLAYQSIGVIYGDIGTSPLYVFSSTFTEPPSREDLLGVLSLVLWSLIMMVTLKYVIIILRADNDGEGGTFSTYALLSRYLNITNRDPREATLIQMKRIKSGDLESAGRHLRHGIEHSKFARGLLQVIGVLAVTMVMSDGVLTPAQSVLGAVQGIEVVAPNISEGTIIGVTDAILVILFLLQPLGVSRLTFAFSPIIVIWLLFNAAFGAYNLVKHDAGVFKAFNPGYAFLFR
jgi:KUP system potassium uptake protein